MAWRDFTRYRPYVLIYRLNSKRGSSAQLTSYEFVLKLCSGIKNISVSESIQRVVQAQVTALVRMKESKTKNSLRDFSPVTKRSMITGLTSTCIKFSASIDESISS